PPPQSSRVPRSPKPSPSQAAVVWGQEEPASPSRRRGGAARNRSAGPAPPRLRRAPAGMFRTATAAAGRRVVWVGGPTPFARCMTTKGVPELSSNQAWLKSLITDVSISSSKELDVVRQRVIAMDRELSAALVKHRDILDEAKRQVNTTTLGAMAVFGSFALFALHLVGKK
ncbi:unnamed protein product, partial [Urochloa humidicola]